MSKERNEEDGFELMTQPSKEVINTMTQLFEKRKLIGLAGPAYCGKDTVGAILKTHFPLKTISFADPIRDALRLPFSLTHEHFYGSLKEVPLPWVNKSPRQLMQTLGTEWGRGMVHEDLWLILAEQKVEELHASGYHVAITDCRFENEAARIRQAGGVVWHIQRDGTKSVNAHKSEAGVAFAWGDTVIDNNGTIEDLVDEVCDRF